jgi:hypothetical protein
MAHRNRFQDLFSLRRLPGLALALLGLGWRLLDYLGRTDIFIRIVESTGGRPAMIASALSSIWFSVGLVLVGIAYVVFVGEPEKGAQRHPWWPYVGWSVFAVCLTAIILVPTYGAIELYIRTQIAKGVSGVPRSSSPASPNSGADHPLYSGPRQLTLDQQRILISEGAKLHAELIGLPITFLETDMEAFSYASALKATFERAAIRTTNVSPQELGEADRYGIMIEVANANAPPPNAVKLQQLLLTADISTKFVSTIDQFRNVPMVLFIGPRPILGFQ